MGAESLKTLIASDQVVKLVIYLGEALLILICGAVVISLVSRAAKKVLHRSSMDPVLYPFIINSLRIICWVILILAVLGKLNVSLAPFITVLGALGAAVALALRDSLANFAGGLLILMTKPFSKGDHISNLEIEGLVQKIDLLFSTLETFDHKVITIPNGKLTNSVIINYTKAEKRRVDCRFDVDQKAELSLVKELLAVCADNDSRVLADPPVFIGVSGQKDGLVNVEMRAWCATDDYWDVLYDLQETVKLAFDEHGIRLPRPQMEVLIRRK